MLANYAITKRSGPQQAELVSWCTERSVAVGSAEQGSALAPAWYTSAGRDRGTICLECGSQLARRSGASARGSSSRRPVQIGLLADLRCGREENARAAAGSNGRALPMPHKSRSALLLGGV